MFKKIFSLTLALVFCATCFVGCSGKKDPNATKDPTDAPSNDSTAEPVPTAVKVVYAANSNFRKAAIKLQDKILSLKGSSLENMSFCVIGTDDKIADDQTVQILLGETNREISANAKAELKSYLDYSVLYDGNKIAIYAYDEAKMLEAAEYVISKISLSNDQTQLIYSGEQKVVKFFTDYELPNATIGSVAISNYSIVYSAQATNVEKDFAKALAEWLMQKTGALISAVDDSTPARANEILVGATNRPESTALKPAATLPEYQYVTSLKDGKLSIYSDTKFGYDTAFTTFKSTVEKNNGALSAAFSNTFLTFDEIKSISVGSPNIKLKDNALYFYKATDEQMDAYGAQNSAMRANATTSAGVRLDFTTDSSTFAFKATKGNCFDLYINGEYKTQITNATTDMYFTTLDTSKGENRITLFLPNHTLGAISTVQLDGGATFKRQEFDRTMLIIGDSITQAYPVASKGYAHQISLFYNADSIIYGVNGGIFDATVLGSTPVCTPNVITVAFGTNDWARGYNEQTIRTNMTAFLDKLQELYPDAKIIGISPLWRNDNNQATPITFDAARELIKSVYRDYGITCINGDELVSHDLSKFADEVHPNNDGHKEYAENLIPQLNELI